jgi:hypothetical protein
MDRNLWALAIQGLGIEQVAEWQGGRMSRSAGTRHHSESGTGCDFSLGQSLAGFM